MTTKKVQHPGYMKRVFKRGMVYTHIIFTKKAEGVKHQPSTIQKVRGLHKNQTGSSSQR